MVGAWAHGEEKTPRHREGDWRFTMHFIAAIPLIPYISPWFGIGLAFLWALFWTAAFPEAWPGHHNLVEEVFLVGCILGAISGPMMLRALFLSRIR